MSNQKHVKTFLGRLELSANESSKSWQALRSREEQHLGPYVRNKSWPGKSYMYIGMSENLEHKLLGTEIQLRRKTCIDLLFEAKGNEHFCVRLDKALEFEGFVDVLSRFEYELLSKMESHTMLGPAYDNHGERLPGIFTIWRALVEDTQQSRILSKV